MSDFNVRSDNVDVEQIMRRSFAHPEKRGVDYTTKDRELANGSSRVTTKGVAQPARGTAGQNAGNARQKSRRRDSYTRQHRGPTAAAALFRPFFKLL